MDKTNRIPGDERSVARMLHQGDKAGKQSEKTGKWNNDTTCSASLTGYPVKLAEA